MTSAWVDRLLGMGRLSFAGQRLGLVWLVVGLGVCWAGQGVYAQDEPVSVPSENSLDAFNIESLLDVKVTTASKRSETLGQSPAAVFVVDSTDISRYAFRTLSDALRSIVGLYTSTDRGFDYLGVRGYSRFGDYNGRILLLIDGHRVNDPIFDTAPIGEDCPIDMQNVERIEVVKGPGSSLWGTNALLATVNIISRDGQHTRGGRFSADAEKFYTEYGNTFAGDFDVDCSVTGVRSDGEKNIYFPEFDSPDTNNGIAENVDESRATRAHLAASYKGWKLLYNRGKRRKVMPTATYETLFNDPGTLMDENRAHVELSFEKPADEASMHGFLARVYKDQYSYTGDYAYDYPPRTINRDDDLAKWWGAEVRLSGVVSDNVSVTCGAEYQRVGYSSQANYDVDPLYEYYQILNTQTTNSLYAQANYQPSELLHFTLGTRCDRYSSFGNTWSPRAALVYSPSNKTSIKALYGSAFRAPNSYELAWREASMPDTQPEKMQTQELVWEQRLNYNSRLITSLFRFEIKDMISLVETEDSWYIANHGSARTSGVEMQYETRSSYGARGYAGICLTRATSTDGQMSNSPNYLFTCGLSVPVLSHRYYLSPQIRTTGKLSTKGGNVIGPAAVVDLALASADYSGGTRVSLSISDIFGRTVYAPAPNELTQDKVPQLGRTLHLTVSREF